MPRRTRRPRRSDAEIRVGGIARWDEGRPHRIGLPEVVLAEGKDVEHLAAIVRKLAARGIGALISRPTELQLRRLRAEAARGRLPITILAGGRVARLEGPIALPVRTARPVALVAAGTADVPVAEECRAIVESLGVRTVTAYDVGVAGLHRLLRALRALRRVRPIAYVVFAGREGALPTVLAGLVAEPVLGVPVSVGYGRGGRGEAALGAMLQSCAPIAVVNIDGAVPAALWAVRLARVVGRLGGRGERRAHRGPTANRGGPSPRRTLAGRVRRGGPTGRAHHPPRR
ncbi:MAG: nickel pincer cofactor biosynthesis protein LarB [Thermoplasmata archaeon]